MNLLETNQPRISDSGDGKISVIGLRLDDYEIETVDPGDMYDDIIDDATSVDEGVKLAKEYNKRTREVKSSRSKEVAEIIATANTLVKSILHSTADDLTEIANGYRRK